MIYVSTGGIKDIQISETLKSFTQAGISHVELSGGPYLEGGLAALVGEKEKYPDLTVSVHNYFPVPKEPFVFNLGSLNAEVFQKSYAHAKNSIDWASVLGSPFYSFHAGFLIDPQVKEIGQKIEKRQLFSREKSMLQFIKAVQELAAYGAKKGVRLLIENNVLSQKNLDQFQENPLLCVTPEETAACLNEVKSGIKLLVDVAHLKVSATSLGFNVADFFSQNTSHIDAYHLSDNDGTADTNDTFDATAWFFPYMKKQVSFTTIEVYGKSPDELKSLVDLVNKKIFI